MMGALAMVGFVFVSRSLVYVIVIGLMVVSMVLATLVTQLLSGRDQRREWAATRKRYLESIERAREEALSAAAIQRAGLEGLYPDGPTLQRLVSDGEGVWERRRCDLDFGSVRLGVGDVPTARRVSVSDNGQVALDPDAELATAAEELVDQTKVLADAPVVVPLTTLGVVAVVGGAEEARGLIGSWLLELAATCAPGDLRFAGLADYRSGVAWDWVKWLPHCRDPQGGEGFGRARRSFTMAPQVFAAEVAALVRQRLETSTRSEPGDIGSPAMSAQWDHVVVVVDGWYPGMLRELEALMALAPSVGVTVLVRVETPDLVPEHCGATVFFDGPRRVRYLEAGPGARVEVAVKPDKVDTAVAEAVARHLAPLRLRDQGAGVSYGDSVRLTDLLGAEDPLAAVDSTRPLDLAQGSSVPENLLTTPIGRDDTGAPVVLNLREAAAGGMGPHGILVGATGSGKSELLKSLAAGLAVGHDPSLLNLLLVDFKGGAAFAGLERLPHVAGLVTNLADESDLITRVREALSGELERRQRVLRDSGNLGSIREYHRTGGTELPYLVVMVDEFGELLAAEPDFVETFNAIGRLGRSLGIHLLLATQRLDEGRVRTLDPHLRYRIGLRTYTAGESRSVLGTAAAYELPPVPGLGYLKVDERTLRFKAAITTLPYRHEREPPDQGEPFRVLTLTGGDDEVDTALKLDDDCEVRTQLDVVVDAVAQRATTTARPVWLAPLPNQLTLGQMNPAGTPLRQAGVAIGLVDRPRAQLQLPLRWNPWERHGNLGIVGAPRTGKSTFLTSLILGTVAADPTVQIYCLDMGGGSLHPLRGLPQVGAMLGPGEPEVAARLLRDLRTVIAEREASRRDDLTHRPPTLVVVVDNIGLLRQTAPDLEPELAAIATTGLQHQVHLVLAAHRWYDIRPQLLDALTFKLELRLGDPVETLTNRTAARSLPVDRPGRGLTSEGELFQAVLPEWDPVPDPLGPHHGVAGAVAAEAGRGGATRAPRIASLPSLVHAREVAGLAAEAGSTPPDPQRWLLGVSEFRNQPVELAPLAQGFHLLVYGDGQSGKTTILGRLLQYLRTRSASGQVRVHLVDPSRTLIDQADLASSYSVSAGATEKLATRLLQELSERVPSEEATLTELRSNRGWEGPQDLLVVDDYDALVSAMGSPLAPLAELIPRAGDIGLHLVVARRVAGVQRNAFEPFSQRLRDLRPPTLILSGTPDEGPLTAGVSARTMPPGRGRLVTATRPLQLIQCCLPDSPVGGAPAAGASSPGAPSPGVLSSGVLSSRVPSSGAPLLPGWRP